MNFRAILSYVGNHQLNEPKIKKLNYIDLPLFCKDIMRQTIPAAFTSLLLLFFLMGLQPGYSQSGCTDPQAINYDPDAMENDGSCEYPPTNYELTQVAILDPLFTETSGLAFIDQQLWTHNDGGNEDEVYRIDTLTGDLQQSVIVATADNMDWEDLAQDDNYLYVGDFGNNSGDRQDLVIYRINRNDLGQNVVNAAPIFFSYEDQTDFTSFPFQTNYDCEAFFLMDDSIHLLTKNWLDYKTKHYVIPAEPGNHVAQLRDSMNVQLLITAADRSEDGTILLLGWNPITGNSALWLLFDYPAGQIFGGNKRRINLGFASNNAQPEGITFSSNTTGWVSSENYLTYPQRLLRFDMGGFLSGMVSSLEIWEDPTIQLFPNPGTETLCIAGPAASDIDQVQIYNVQGQLLHSYQGLQDLCLTPQVPAGQYWVRIICGWKVHTSVWIRQ
jgi:hypothetical protein